MNDPMPAGPFLLGPDPNPRFTKIEYPPFDRDGRELDLANGIRCTVDEVVFVKSDKKLVPDFPYDYGSFLLVRRSSYSLLTNLNLAGAQIVPGALVEKDGTLIEEINWINVLSRAPVMNRVTSTFEEADGILRKVSCYVVDQCKVPDLDLFRCEDIRQVVASREFAEVIQKNGLTGVVITPLNGGSWP